MIIKNFGYFYIYFNRFTTTDAEIGAKLNII
jgi:hypothetical protein